MRITEIRTQKKHLEKVIFENGEELLLDRDTCKEYALRPGSMPDEKALEEMRWDSAYRRAKSRALWYLDRADRTEKGLYRKLLTAGFDERVSAAVIARLKELELLDDRRFAEHFSERCREAGFSKRQAIAKMLEKGVPYALAKEQTDAWETDESEQIRLLIEKKYARKLEEENGVQRVYAALVRKGFSFGAVREALKKYSEELENSEEF